MHRFRLFVDTRVFLIALSLLCVLQGCGGGTKSGPKTTHATGKVTYKDVPVAGANVAFLGDGTIQAAQATTDSNGEFVLQTSGSDGAVPGTHQVTVIKIAQTAPAATKKAGATSMESAAKANREAASGGAPAIQHLLPERYSKASTSGLQYTVKDGDKNRFEISLSD
jgi:hypothetical protein